MRRAGHRTLACPRRRLQPEVSDSFSFEDFLAQQRAEYRASLPGRQSVLLSAWSRLQAGQEPAAALHDLERCAHGLAGSAATFGLAGLGDAARALEDAIDTLPADAVAVTALAAPYGHLAALLEQETGP